MGSGRKDLLEEGCGQNRKPQVAHERALPQDGAARDHCRVSAARTT